MRIGVPKAWRKRVAIAWGLYGPVSAQRIEGCAPPATYWSGYGGGFFLKRAIRLRPTRDPGRAAEYDGALRHRPPLHGGLSGLAPVCAKRLLRALKFRPFAADGRGMVDKSDLLRPVDIATRIGDVLFTVGQVCTIAGITKMQLDLWTERAAIATLGVKQRLYDADAVEHVMLIAQARDLGFSVDAAIEAAASFRARTGGDQPGRLAA